MQSNEREDVTKAPSESYEEFDISTFDFSIADPGEAPAEEPKKAEIPAKAVEAPPAVKQTKNAAKKVRAPKEKPVSSDDSDRVLSFGKSILRYALRPAGLYDLLPEWLWPVALLGVALLSTLFYTAVALDWKQNGLIADDRVGLFLLIGAVTGACSALLFAAGSQLLSLLCNRERISPFRMLFPLCGAAVYPTLLLIAALIVQAVGGVAVSMSFGVVALLWWLFILLEILRDRFGAKFFPIITFVTVFGYLIFAVMTLTFSLR